MGFSAGLEQKKLKRLMWDDVNLKEGFVTVGALRQLKKEELGMLKLTLNAIEILTPFIERGRGFHLINIVLNLTKKLED